MGINLKNGYNFFDKFRCFSQAHRPVFINQNLQFSPTLATNVASSKLCVKMLQIAKFIFNFNRNYRSKPFVFGDNCKNIFSCFLGIFCHLQLIVKSISCIL